MKKAADAKRKNLFHAIWNRFLEWYSKNRVRKIFLYAFLLALAVLCVSTFLNPNNIVFMAFLGIVFFCICLLIADIGIAKREFNAVIAEVTFIHYQRMAEKYEAGEKYEDRDCFSDDDLKRIKRRNTNYKVSILLLVVFLVFLIVFFVQMM